MHGGRGGGSLVQGLAAVVEAMLEEHVSALDSELEGES